MPIGAESNKKKKIAFLLMILLGSMFLIIVGSVLALYVTYIFTASINSEGSPELAAEWSEEMATWESPAEATNDRTVSVYEFPRGEWAIVRSKNSHGGLWGGGGTVVIKDSRDQLNVFHQGHVCGDGNPLISGEYDDLDSFYEALTLSDFRQFTPE